MTDGRKNEIWAMLTQEEKTEIRQWYANNYGTTMPLHVGFHTALSEVFGKHNLTAQAEEKPKEPKFKVGDRVQVVNMPTSYFNGMVGEVVFTTEKFVNVKFPNRNCWVELDAVVLAPYTEPKSENDKTIVSNAQNCENPTENGISDSKIQPKSAESVETITKSLGGIHVSSSGEVMIRHDIDYQQYRLDLAKEIAVAMINTYEQTPTFNDKVAYDSVDIANEIVKRLKETEE